MNRWASREAHEDATFCVIYLVDETGHSDTAAIIVPFLALGTDLLAALTVGVGVG